jgi:hypothetical protein
MCLLILLSCKHSSLRILLWPQMISNTVIPFPAIDDAIVVPENLDSVRLIVRHAPLWLE